MAIPEGYEKLAIVGIAYKGEYAADTAYKVMNAVYYDGSTYVALRDNPTGPPAADSSNWQYLAKGFVAALLSMITATDTNGIMGTAGAEVEAQSLIDAMASKMVSEFVNNADLTQKLADYIAKSAIVQTESTATNTVPSSAYFKQVIDTQNSNLNVRYSSDNDKIQVYYEDKWINVFGATGAQTYYLYNSGNEYTMRTGGWKIIGTNDATKTRENALGVSIENSPETKTETYTISKVDLTGFKWLIFSILDITLPKLWNNRVGITSNNTGLITPTVGKQYDAAANNLTDGNLLKVDISSYQGDYYIALYQTTGGGNPYATGGCYYDKIWLE